MTLKAKKTATINTWEVQIYGKFSKMIEILLSNLQGQADGRTEGT